MKILHSELIPVAQILDVLIEDVCVKNGHVIHVAALDLLRATIIVSGHRAYKNFDYVYI